MDILSKEELLQEISLKSDEIYAAYLLAVKQRPIQDQLLDVLNSLPEYSSSASVITEDQKDQLISDLKKIQRREEIAFTIGKMIVSVGIKAIIS